MGFRINKRSVYKVNSEKIKGDFYEILLPAHMDFGGMEDINGNQIGELGDKQYAKMLVRKDCLMNDHVDEENYYFVKLDDDFNISTISIDLGATQEVLPNGKNKHNFTKIKNLKVSDLKIAMKGDRWNTFTISKNQMIEYETKDGTQRAIVLIPNSDNAGKYASTRFSINRTQIKDIKDHDNILKVSVPLDGEFTIFTSEIVGQNEDGQNVYSDNKVIGKIKGNELCHLFDYDNKEKSAIKDINNDKNIDENSEEYEGQQF